jgi:hypothetical protein
MAVAEEAYLSSSERERATCPLAVFLTFLVGRKKFGG